MDRSLQCQCGHLRGQLSNTEKSTRIMCYCKDCQAFAHYLGKAGDMIDAQGGVDVAVSQPEQVSFTSGTDALACMSLSSKGMLRWYASCCNTPIGNTARDSKMAFVGLSVACVADSPAKADSVFGPIRMRSHTGNAKGEVPSSGLAAVATMAGFAVKLLRARVGGGYLRTPFFKPGGKEPVAAPKVLSTQEYERLKALC